MNDGIMLKMKVDQKLFSLNVKRKLQIEKDLIGLRIWKYLQRKIYTKNNAEGETLLSTHS